MTWLPWLGLLLGALATVAGGLTWIGASRWAALIRAEVTRLDTGRLDLPGADQGRLSSPVRFDSQELEGLPVPVQRYFRAVLTEGQPIVSAATLEMAGTINMSFTERWKPFTSRQRVVTRRPGFVWDARVALFPGLPAYVQDSYIAGQGRLRAKLLGVFTVADASGGGELARGELMRYFAEAAWYPTALLPSQGVQWQAADDTSAHATIVDGPITLTLLFTFDDAGLIASVRADARACGVGHDMVMLPWDCRYRDYRPQDGMSIPRSGEAAWVRPDGRKAYFVGRVGSLRYEFVPAPASPVSACP